jgi:hypothetical protein
MLVNGNGGNCQNTIRFGRSAYTGSLSVYNITVTSNSSLKMKEKFFLKLNFRATWA